MHEPERERNSKAKGPTPAGASPYSDEVRDERKADPAGGQEGRPCLSLYRTRIEPCIFQRVSRSPGWDDVPAMGLLKRKTPEEKAAAKAEKEARKAAFRAQLDDAREVREQKKRDEQAVRLEKIKATLQPDEIVEAEFLTAESISKKDLVFTSKRLIVAPTYGDDMESIPYRAVTSFRTENFLGDRFIKVEVMSRRDTLELKFKEEADRARALEVLNTHAL